MELIEQFTENEKFLNAVKMQFQTHINLSVPDAPENVISTAKVGETMSKVLSEPIGVALFHQYLKSRHCFELALFIEAIDEYNELPEGAYKKHKSCVIVNKFLSVKSRMPIGLSTCLKSKILTLIAASSAPDNGDTTTSARSRKELRTAQHSSTNPSTSKEIFAAVRRCVLRDLRISVFPSFLESSLYNRLVSFRYKENSFVTRKDFNFIRVLGQGGFGKVYAAQKNDTMQMYACKAMSKDKVIERKREKLLENERMFLTRTPHPFIIGLKYAFQDHSTLYFVLDLIMGGELEFHLKHRGKFPIPWVRFFLGGIVLALEHLHNNDIVYRDLKPENVLLDDAGYVCLVDLGLCATLKPNDTLSDHCGTRSFMAPEQCTSSYRFEVDWWALGVTAFKLLTGQNPFSRIWRDRVKKEDIVSTIITKSIRRVSSVFQSSMQLKRKPSAKIPFQNQPINEKMIAAHGAEGFDGQKEENDDDMKKKQNRESARLRKVTMLLTSFESTIDELTFPDDIDLTTREFVMSLLKMNPKQRLGHLGAEQVKSHAFFYGFDWQKLHRKHLVPPFVPSSRIVHAEYVKTPEAQPSQKQYHHFPDFEYVMPMAYQKEIIGTIHNFDDLENFRKYPERRSGL